MSLLDDLESLLKEAASQFTSVRDEASLEAARVDFLGNRGRLKGLLGRMAEIPRELKPAVGKRANEIGSEIQTAFEASRARIQSSSSASNSGSAEVSSLETLRHERLDKLKQYEEKFGKGAAWGMRFPDRTSGKALSSTTDIRKKFPLLQPGEQVNAELKFGTALLAGRVMLRREQSKKLIFLTVQDQSGSIQVALWNNLLNEEILLLLRDTLDLWDIIGVEGELAYTQRGEPTLWATSARILTKCIAPPTDKHHGIHDKEIRYRQRYLDLISTHESRKTFILRSKAISEVRRFLDEQGFLEMETPVLQTIPGGAAARPFKTELNALNMPMYLRIATEIPLKKLLVGGIERVYELGRIFRNEGIDARHNPEFTTVELYQAYGDLRDMMAITENLISQLALKLTGSTTVKWRGQPVKLGAPWPRLDYCELLKKHAGVTHDDVAGLDRKLKEKGLHSEGLSLVDKIDGVFSEYAEPHLQDACFIINQPVEMSPLCRAHPDNPQLADRFEAFAANMELANAYTELNDPLEQRKRLCEQLRQNWLAFLKTLSDAGIALNNDSSTAIAPLAARITDNVNWHPENDGDAFPVLTEIRKQIPKSAGKQLMDMAEKLADPGNSLDEDFVCAMEHGMPPAGGLGIGIDRVVMLLAGVDSIRDVILFPLMRN